MKSAETIAKELHELAERVQPHREAIAQLTGQQRAIFSSCINQAQRKLRRAADLIGKAPPPGSQKHTSTKDEHVPPSSPARPATK